MATKKLKATPMLFRDRLIGRYARQVRWAVLENVIIVDWREVRSGFSNGVMPRR
jgi:hypothetical protein